MGSELFGVDIAGIVADTLGPGLLEVTISREAKLPTRQAGNLTGGLETAAPQTWTCRGYWEDFTGMPPPGVELDMNDRKAVLIGDTIPAAALPLQANDAITCEGQTLYMVKLLARDPAGAVYSLLCRDRRGKSGV